MAKSKRKSRSKRVPVLLRRLREHFQGDPAELPVIEQNFARYERPNLHLAVEELLNETERRTRLVGIVVDEEYHSLTLSKLSRKSSSRSFNDGPVEYIDVSLADGRQLACVKRGLYLFGDEEKPVAMLLTEERFYQNIIVEVMGVDRESAEQFLRRLARLVRYGKAFRGHVLSVEEDCHRQLTVHFHQLPPVRRTEIILPESVLGRIERQSLRFSQHAEKLRSAGRHLKRGILLHGPPGTGKTLSAMYLAAQMPGRTVLLITGQQVGTIMAACKLARMLEPATVILEDVDLIGTERSAQSLNANSLLFELLNQMDGLAEDADILFLLTTNRPEILEPALAARPGRIDLAIEVPLPDADCRRRLLELYGRGMQVEVADQVRLLARTEGTSGAFIRELLRKAAGLRRRGRRRAAADGARPAFRGGPDRTGCGRRDADAELARRPGDGTGGSVKVTVPTATPAARTADMTCFRTCRIGIIRRVSAGKAKSPAFSRKIHFFSALPARFALDSPRRVVIVVVGCGRKWVKMGSGPTS